jgi:uncharacterized protein YjiS (DUF1127 family)
MKGISHAIQEVAPGETGVVTPTLHIHIYKGERSMTTLIMTADKIGLHSVAEWFKRLNASIERRSQARRTINELSRLSDYQLRDMGLTRGDIYSIAWGERND